MPFSVEEIEANRRYFEAKLRANRQLQDLLHKVRRDAASIADFVLVDMRGRDAFAKAHVPGAVCLPPSELAALAAQLPRERELVTFCWSHF